MKVVGLILLAIITSIATTVGFHYANQKYGFLTHPAEPPPKRAVPSLLGLSEGDAKANLDTLGLKLIVGARTASADAKEGTVIQQTPKAGDAVSAGEAVTLTFSLAPPPPPKVPDVVGKTVAEATQALTQAGYTVKEGSSVQNDKLPPGQVVTQAPAAGGPLKLKEVVTLHAVAAPDDVKVPKLTGLGAKAAKTAAEKAKLKLAIQWMELAETASNVVLRQDPVVGTTVKPDSEVKVFINR